MFRTHIPLSTCPCQLLRKRVELHLCPDHDAALIRSIERGDPRTDFEPIWPKDPDDPIYRSVVAVSAPEITVPPGACTLTLTAPIPKGMKIRHGGLTIEFA